MSGVKPVPCLREVLQSQENQADFEAISARNRLSIAYFGFKINIALGIYPWLCLVLGFLGEVHCATGNIGYSD